MTRTIDLIVPDSGPLISLAHADRLDLVEVFDRPVTILDVVKMECLKKPESPDHDRLADWFARTANRIVVVPTPLGSTYRSAMGDEASGRNHRATRGLGDAAIAWLLANIDTVATPGSTPLVLLEDRNLSMTLARTTAHILSTRAWLTGLEAAGVIDSAAEIVAQIRVHGRSMSELTIDRPSVSGGRDSSWIDAMSSKHDQDND